MKDFIKAYCASSAVKRRAVWGRKPVCKLHAWAALIWPWEKQTVRQIEKGETDGVTVFLCLSHSVTLTDWLASVIVTQKKSFIPTKSAVLCLLSAGVFYPAVSSLPPRPKDAMRALKKRLCGNKNYKEVMLALTVRASGFHPYVNWTSPDLSFHFIPLYLLSWASSWLFLSSSCWNPLHGMKAS